MRAILLGLTLAMLALASPPAGQPPRDAREAFQGATQVFLGRVTAVGKDKLGFASQATVAIQRTLKGDRQGTVLVSGAGGPTHPARLFQVGEELLFYLGDDLRADSYLRRVVKGEEIKKDLKTLGL
jgi:hypothetical protein